MFEDKLYFVVVFLLIVISVGASITQHEFAHKTFNDNFGLESEYFFDLPWVVGVRSYGIQPEELKLLHGFNEVVSYNLSPYFTGILCILFVGFWYVGHKIDSNVALLEKRGVTINMIKDPSEKLENLGDVEAIKW